MPDRRRDALFLHVLLEQFHQPRGHGRVSLQLFDLSVHATGLDRRVVLTFKLYFYAARTIKCHIRCRGKPPPC